MSDIAKWFNEASLSDINTGVGCPLCKHEGPYWVEACRLHTHLQAILEDKHISERSLHELSQQHGRVLEALGLDWEDDPVSAISDLREELRVAYTEEFEAMRLNELDEIADGAFGDGPRTRGLARAAAEDIRAAQVQRPTPPQSLEDSKP